MSAVKNSNITLVRDILNVLKGTIDGYKYVLWKNEQGSSALQMAVSIGNSTIVAALLPDDMRAGSGWPLLRLRQVADIAFNGDPEDVQTLLNVMNDDQRDALIEFNDFGVSGGLTVLMASVRRCDLRRTQMILNFSKASKRMQILEWRGPTTPCPTALHFAVWWCADAIPMLLEACRDEESKTELLNKKGGLGDRGHLWTSALGLTAHMPNESQRNRSIRYIFNAVQSEENRKKVCEGAGRDGRYACQYGEPFPWIDEA
eukprot:TRINITY_DN37391_c0_g1_i1.p1 TRINITY_DN37391_c0_g1~~TRINITY_DN37391_c0_g1_i1.p1  ORF type:complete len:259 (-),score=26.77 TRINITY_DN37391_c0_g1_i1:166-942(-)